MHSDVGDAVTLIGSFAAGALTTNFNAPRVFY